MKYRLLLALLAVLLISATAFYIHTKEDHKKGPIIVFGDSITAGVGVEAGKDFVSLINQKFERELVNAGVSGNTTTTALSRVENDIVNKDPALVIIELGGNDFLQGLPPETTESNLGQIIERSQTTGAEIILLGIKTGLRTDEIYLPIGHRLRDNYKIDFEEDIFTGIFGNQNLMADPIHPNTAGHAIIAERLGKVLKEKGY